MKVTMEWPGKNIPRTGIAIASHNGNVFNYLYEQLGIYT